MIKRRFRSILGAIVFTSLLAASIRGSSTNDLVTTVAQIDRARILKLAADALALTSPAVSRLSRNAIGRCAGAHVFYSQADFYCAESENESGLPYVSRDGFTNPNNFEYHRLAMRQMKDAVAALTAAYAITGDDSYVPRAQELLRVSFSTIKPE